MTDIRRTVLWVIFTLSLFLLWDAWNRHAGNPSIFGGPAKPAASPTAPIADAPTGVPTPSSSTVAAPATPAAASIAQAGEKVTLTTDVVRATFDTTGGTLVRVELLAFPDAANADGHVVLLDTSATRFYQAQTGLVAAQPGPALPTHQTPMLVVSGERDLREGSDALTLRFESAAAGGVKLVKTYTLRRGDYAIGVTHEVVNESDRPVAPHLYLQLQRDGSDPAGSSSFYNTFTGPAVYTDAKRFQKIDFKSIEKRGAGEAPSHATQSNDGWIAMVQHYFASAWIVPAGTAREFRSTKARDNVYSISMILPLGEIAPGAEKTEQATLFVGPQDEKKLEALAPGLELVKDYGWLTILAKPLFWLLDHLHGWLGNWGWAIVALVVLLKAAFYWLNASAYRSMAKMKAINPKLVEMRERLKDKPQQMQQEMMRIYREEKVNPIGGCLPIFLQMPFFIALYWVLLSSAEMRGAPWIGWIHDLSVRDPFFILPLLMTASSMFQVWLNPTPADPMQARLMWMMPLVFSVMFFFFPAGLVLYWLTNNILSIAQQWFINKRLGVLNK